MKSTAMSPKYHHQQTEELRDWFKAKLAALPDIVLTQSDYNVGVDALEEPFASLTKQAFVEWLGRNYEISYNQMCSSFFRAALELGKLRMD